MESIGQMIHVAPSDQPTSVHQIVQRLFPVYTVDGGSVHLAGCTLEDRLFLRLQFRHGSESLEIYVDADGQEVDGGLLESLTRIIHGLVATFART